MNLQIYLIKDDNARPHDQYSSYNNHNEYFCLLSYCQESGIPRIVYSGFTSNRPLLHPFPSSTYNFTRLLFHWWLGASGFRFFSRYNKEVISL